MRKALPWCSARFPSGPFVLRGTRTLWISRHRNPTRPAGGPLGPGVSPRTQPRGPAASFPAQPVPGTVPRRQRTRAEVEMPPSRGRTAPWIRPNSRPPRPGDVTWQRGLCGRCDVRDPGVGRWPWAGRVGPSENRGPFIAETRLRKRRMRKGLTHVPGGATGKREKDRGRR